MSSADFRNSIKVSNSLDLDQARLFIGPGLGPTCLQRLSADDTCIGFTSHSADAQPEINFCSILDLEAGRLKSSMHVVS